jgi:hypothetical protein
MVPKSLRFIKNKLGISCVLRLFCTFVTLKMGSDIRDGFTGLNRKDGSSTILA